MSKELNNTINWEVVETEIDLITPYGTSIKDTKHKGFVRSDNWNPLAIHSKSYGTMFNKELMDYTEQIAESLKAEIVGYNEFNGGKNVLSVIKAPQNVQAVNGFEIQDYIIIGNSHSNRGTFLGTSTFIPRCTNSFGQIVKNYTIRHTSNAVDRRREIVNMYQIYKEQVEVMYNKFEKMKNIEIDPMLKKALIDRLFDIDHKEEMSTRKSNILTEFNKSYKVETDALGENLWGLFNAGTHYSTHGIKEKKETNSYGNMLGQSASFNNKLYELVLEHV